MQSATNDRLGRLLNYRFFRIARPANPMGKPGHC